MEGERENQYKTAVARRAMHLFGVPKRCGDRPCGDLEIPQDFTAQSVTARSWDPGGPSRPRRPRRRPRVPKPCGDPESPPTHHT
eukprot:8062686-Pyramimonas_sp.AAC.1